MGGRHDPAVPLPELLDDGDRQCGALHRVGAGTQLIQQYQRAVPCYLQNGDNVGHVRREGGQTLFDALFIADVGQHFVKHRQAAAVRSRNHQAAHHHQSEQAHCLEQDCLTTGIGACDHQGVKINAQGHIHRDDLLRVNERMPGPDQLDLPVTGDLRHRSLHLVCQTALGKVEIQLHQHLIAAADGLSIAAH